MLPGNEMEVKLMRSIQEKASRKVLLIVVLLLLTLLLVACENSESEFLAQLAVDWAVEKGIMSLRCEGEGQTNCTYDLNEMTLGFYLGTVKWATSKNRSPEMQAALDAGDVVYNQEQADELVERGARKGDLSLIDQAIESRPDDWSYHDQRASVLLASGDIEGAEQSFSKAEALVDSRIANGEDCFVLQRNLLNNRIAALEIQLDKKPADGELNDRYAGAYEQLQALESGGPGSPCAE